MSHLVAKKIQDIIGQIKGFGFTSSVYSYTKSNPNEPRRKEICLRGFRSSRAQAGADLGFLEIGSYV